MLGLFRLFGRSPELRALDEALREAGLHPQIVPEAVKLTVLRLLKNEAGAGASLSTGIYHDAAQLIGYCMQGRDAFVASNSARAADHAEQRIESATEAGDSLDAKLILLTLHAGVIAPDVVERFGLETE